MRIVNQKILSFLALCASPVFAQTDPFQPTRDVDIPEIPGYVYCWGDEFDKDGACFDLCGRRMARPIKRGIYIAGHKKWIQ